ncbi:2759_t:CDS:2, partial [Cetraspora pellucida]
TSKNKEKASDDENFVGQIGSNSGRQNESDKPIRYNKEGNSNEQNKLGFCNQQGVNTDKNRKKMLHQIIIIKIGNSTSNYAKACNKATQKWNKNQNQKCIRNR